MASNATKAWVTLLTKVSYLPGVLVLNYSLKSAKSKYPMVVMVVPSLRVEARGVLERQGIMMREIDFLTPSSQNLSFKDDRFADTWTKLRCFEMDEYERVVLLDADMLVRNNMDELMDLPLDEGWIAAAHACACNPRKLAHYPADWIPANCGYSSLKQPAELTDESPRPYHLLNSGMVVLNPSAKGIQAITDFLSQSPLVPTFRFPDQDLLAELYKGRWKPVLWKYNALKTLRVIHKHLWNDDDVKCLHYILTDKPWMSRPSSEEGGAIYDESHPSNEERGGIYDDINRWWWKALSNVGAEMNSEDGTEATREDWKLVEANVASA